MFSVVMYKLEIRVDRPNVIMQKVLCAFIELIKAFDGIHLNGMWFKLFNLGVDGRMHTTVRSMHQEVQSIV